MGSLFFYKEKMREIKNVFVEWIALVSKKNKPAVEKAETKYAIFKISIPKEKIKKIKDNLEKIKSFLKI